MNGSSNMSVLELCCIPFNQSEWLQSFMGNGTKDLTAWGGKKEEKKGQKLKNKNKIIGSCTLGPSYA